MPRVKYMVLTQSRGFDFGIGGEDQIPLYGEVGEIEKPFGKNLGEQDVQAEILSQAQHEIVRSRAHETDEKGELEKSRRAAVIGAENNFSRQQVRDRRAGAARGEKAR